MLEGDEFVKEFEKYLVSEDIKLPIKKKGNLYTPSFELHKKLYLHQISEKEFNDEMHVLGIEVTFVEFYDSLAEYHRQKHKENEQNNK